VPNENENTSNELDDLFTTSDSSEGDDFFSLGETNANTTDDSASSDDSGSVSIDVESDPFGTSDSSASDALSDDSPFGVPPTEETPVVAPAPVAEETGKKGKKDKKDKKEKPAKKEKAPKEPKAAKKEKAPKEPKAPKIKRPYVGSPLSVYVFFIALALIVACVVVAAFAIGGSGAVTFLIPAGILAIVMLAVPFMLLSHLRKEPIGLFDMFLALAVVFSVMSAIVVLAYQAKTYGASSKVATNVPAVVASLDC